MSDDTALADAIAWAELMLALIENGPYPVSRHYSTQDIIDHLRTLIAAARAQVPREPTQEMIDVGANLAFNDQWGQLGITPAEIWLAMYDAAMKGKA